MIYAQILNGVVVNTIVLNDTSLISLFSQGFDYFMRIDDLTPQPGVKWTYNGSVFTPPAAAPMPDVTPRQIRQALILSGVSLSSIDAAIATLPDPAKSLAQAEWEYSVAFQRNRPLVDEVRQMLGWTNAQVDALWALAATL